MWTDESRFALDFHDGRVRVHRMSGQRFAPCCLLEHDRYGGGSVMVWAGIWYGGRRTDAVVIKGTLNAERYKNDIVEPIVVPTVQQHGLIFQDDNATPHRGGSVRAALRDSGIRTLPWPARSPDLSPIEHAWDELGRRVRCHYPHAPSTLEELSHRLCEQWALIEDSFIDKLCDSMPHRIQRCLEANGGHTRY